MLASLLISVVFAPAQPRLSPPRFVAHATNPAVQVGYLRSLSPDGAVILAEPAATIPAGSLVALRRADVPLPSWPREPMIVFANGDRVRGTVTGGDTRSVGFTPHGLAGGKRGGWSVPLSTIAAVWITPPPADTPPNPSAYPWADSPRRRDAVLLNNGDVTRGTVEGFTSNPAGVRIKTGVDAAATTLPLATVAAVAFDPRLVRARTPKGPYYHLVAADGSRVGMASVEADWIAVQGTTLFGGKVELPLADVVALDVRQGKAVYLSDLKPAKAATEGYNGVTWPWAADRTVRGFPLRLGGLLGEQTFDKGLGTHSRTTLAYALGGKYRRFDAVVGLDPVTGRRGAVDLKVLVDGKPAAVDGLTGLSAAGSPKSVSVDVTGAKELALVVDYGPGGDVQDDVNWCDARLVE